MRRKSQESGRIFRENGASLKSLKKLLCIFFIAISKTLSLRIAREEFVAKGESGKEGGEKDWEVRHFGIH